jgi:hypothetical protein
MPCASTCRRRRWPIAGSTPTGPAQVEREARVLAGLRPDLVLSDVAYLPLAAPRVPASRRWRCARSTGPSCSPISLPARDWAAEIHGQMLAAYHSAECFLRLTPGMGMPELRAIAQHRPGGCTRQRLSAGLASATRCATDERLVLIAFGGVSKQLPIADWPAFAGVRWLMPQDWQLEHPSVSRFEPLGRPMTDLLRSVDAVIAKPGYGTFAEAACNGTPVLYVRRSDWPEQDA